MAKQIIDPKLVREFQSGSESAFAQIYKIYSNRIFFVAYNHVNNEEVAQDVVQNTFLSVYKSINKLKTPEAFHVWIMRIAYTESINVLRSNKNKSVELPEFLDVNSMEDESNVSMDSHMDGVMLREAIAKEINTMDNKLKDVAILRYVEDLSEKEISYILKIPKGTVKSRAHRAKIKLQGSLRKSGITPATYKTYGFSIPVLFASGFQYIQGTIVSSTPEYTSIATAVKTAGAAGAAGGILAGAGGASVAKKVILGGILAAIPVTLFLMDDKNEPKAFEGEMMVKPDIDFEEEVCQIESITYNEEYTNQAIKVEVHTSNDLYDQILLNDKESMYIEENGQYVVKIMKDGQVVDEQIIVINNIDKASPVYVRNDVVGTNKYILYLEDDVSGVDPAKIEYYKNGNRSYDYTYNVNSNSIEFIYEDFSENIFIVYDYANNDLEITVISENLYKNQEPFN
ncbi:sigma-70 family RNA polymerase sigma factor [Breznakia pachnodae]|uniref:RNA polymerase sigma factor (Sigma-70 family) n=1 Tax=Breznakia pachnodae TaxID=265178 RepID=A0ABU0E550_9FIRM|nr:sigma-70 family RNA polymerase sigma factor [Breznakia pachnodae]MDQ0361851.1 RNA polymerase sigma factor (sigma-70 family) [Breznakia pachnodae]